jgi:hypothetical protein
LHYSGLGLAEAGSESLVRASKSGRADAAMMTARRDLEAANREAERADAEVEITRRAVALAEDDLKRLKAAAAQAIRRATDAHRSAAAAKKKAAL